MTLWKTGAVPRRLVLIAVLACFAALPAVPAVAQTSTTPTTTTDQTVTTPEDVGQDFGGESQSGTAPAAQNQAPGALPATGWRGRYALALGALLLIAGCALRAATRRRTG